MIFSYIDTDIRSLCEKEEIAIAKLGPDIAAKLQDRLSDLEALEFVSEIFEGDGQVNPNNPSEYYMNIGETTRLVFSSGHAKTPNLSNEAINWSKVFRIQIIKIVDHEKQ